MEEFRLEDVELKNKIRDIERARFILYNNSEAVDFILRFFNVGKDKGGTRCRVWTKDLENGRQIIARYGKNQKLVSLGEENIMKQLFEGHTTYFYEFIFDIEGIKHAFTKNQKKKQVIGVSCVMDIDAPNIFSETEGIIGRKNMFDFVDSFDSVLEIVDSEMNEVGIDYKISSSGNGIYIIAEPFYSDSVNEVYLFADKFSEMINDINHLKGSNPVDIHDNAKAWSYYYKCPMSFHVSKQRLSIPLRKGGEIDWDWMKRITDIKNLNMNNCEEVVSEIIRKCEWYK